MPILSIRHVTTYHYHQPVAFGAHRMMLRPRDDDDQKLIHSEIEITPKPRQLTWTMDAFGNHVATADFADRAAELRFVSNIRLDHAPRGFRATDIADLARTYPFTYPAEDWPALERFTQPPSSHIELDRWSAAFFRTDGSADTHDLLVDMTRTIRRTFRHEARHEKGIQNPVQTLKLGSGSCRDLAVLMIAVLRSRGIAARFVSGYLHLPDDGDDQNVTGGNTHAWAHVYVPGPGWLDFDPSSGIVGNRNLVRVAVVHHPREAIPLQGTWFGNASDHLAMKVSVKVAS
jgi:transglutaminase-like putative cysteine protease